jgi:hypothetical protein
VGDSPQAQPKSIRAFSIGHSLSAEIPDMVAGLATSSGLQFSFQEQFRLGAPLFFQFGEGTSAKAAKYDDGKFRTTYTKAFPNGGFDALILIDSVPRGGTQQEASTLEYLVKFSTEFRKSNGKGVVYFAEPWHDLRSGSGSVQWDTASPTRNLPWRQRVRADAEMWSRIANDASKKSGIRVRVIPQAQALGELTDAIDAGRVPGFRNHKEIFADDIHVNPYGMYFIACVQYGVLFGRSPEGLAFEITNRWKTPYWNHKFFDGKTYAKPNAEGIREMQKIAWKYASTVR